MAKSKKEKIDLSKGINIQIGGEIGKYNTLPVAVLVRVAENLQNLLETLAKNDLNSTDPIHLDDFQIELSGFSEGSAVPQFVFSPRIQASISNVDEQRKQVNKKFNKLMQVASTGDFLAITTLYPDPNRRNQIVDRLYDFTNSFGNSPTSIVELSKTGVKPFYKINKLKAETRNRLVTEIVSKVAEQKEEYGVAKVKMTTNKKGQTKNRIQQIYKTSGTTLSYAPKVIVHEKRAYILNFPLRCSLENEDGYHIIQNEMLDIIGTGKTEDEAEKNFSEEFDFIYRRYNQLSNDKLSEKLQRIKFLLGYFVKKIE